MNVVLSLAPTAREASGLPITVACGSVTTTLYSVTLPVLRTVNV